jgi:hypothetical protein
MYNYRFALKLTYENLTVGRSDEIKETVESSLLAWRIWRDLKRFKG